MKENREVTDTNVEDIEEALEKLSTGKKIKLYELLRTFKKEGIENFVTTRKKYVDVILSDYKRVLKENEELLQEKINNQKIIALAQNDMLDYQAGFEDGKNRRTSAVQSIIENQQYYIFQKQIEKYERHIEKLQKENEGLNNRCRNLDTEAQAYLEELAGDNTLTRRTIKQLQEENEELKEKENKIYKEVQENLAFEKFLIVKERKPDLFNQGRFYISQIIYDILNDVQNPEGIHKENKCIQYIDYIPVQKVKDNIKKLEIKKEKARGERNILERFAIEKSINSLQELLEKRK